MSDKPTTSRFFDDDSAQKRQPRQPQPSRRPPPSQTSSQTRRQTAIQQQDNSKQQAIIDDLSRRNRKLEQMLVSNNKRISHNTLNSAKMSGSVRYLHINSRHLPRQANEETFVINLLEPIRNASHMELIAFSVANDFSNVLPDNNKFRILFKRTPETNSNLALNDVYMIEVELAPNFYTHAEILSEIINQITTTENGYYDSTTQSIDADGFYTVYPKHLESGTSVFVNQTQYAVLIKATAEANGKTTFEFKHISATVNGLKFALLSYPFEKYDEYFHDSILHRLGYSKNQVYFSDEDITNTLTVFKATSQSENRLVLTNQRIIFPEITVDDIAMSSIDITAYSRNFSNSAKTTYKSAKLAFETHSHLRLTCDLIHDIQGTTHNYKTLGKTEMSDVLCEIPIDTNRASWIHYIPQSYTHFHKIDNPLIRNFRIGLKNAHNDQHFKSDEHKQFQITLKIYLMDDESVPNQQFFDSIKRGEQNFSYKD